ncbi:MAG: hypothetical protein H7331_06665 [Bacteroidia bacterium]|nr:hypothetical protein [Bacteroidia bacterium]
MKKIILSLLLSCTLCILNITAYSQCAMCKAAVESNASSSSQAVGRGLNDGILYLMTVPYILLILLFWYFFGGKIKVFLTQFKNIYPNVN